MRKANLLRELICVLNETADADRNVMDLLNAIACLSGCTYGATSKQLEWTGNG